MRGSDRDRRCLLSVSTLDADRSPPGPLGDFCWNSASMAFSVIRNFLYGTRRAWLPRQLLAKVLLRQVLLRLPRCLLIALDGVIPIQCARLFEH